MNRDKVISISEKIKLLNKLSHSKYKDKHLIGTGLNDETKLLNNEIYDNNDHINKFCAQNFDINYRNNFSSRINDNSLINSKSIELFLIDKNLIIGLISS